MRGRSFLFFTNQTKRHYAHGSPIHLAFQEKLSEQLEEYRNINRQLQKSQDTQTLKHLILHFGEDSKHKPSPVAHDSTSFDNGLKTYKQKLTKNMISILAEIRKECANTDDTDCIRAAPRKK